MYYELVFLFSSWFSELGKVKDENVFIFLQCFSNRARRVRRVIRRSSSFLAFMGLNISINTTFVLRNVCKFDEVRQQRSVAKNMKLKTTSEATADILDFCNFVQFKRAISG